MNQFATAFLALHPHLAAALAIAAGACVAWTVPATFIARYIKRPDAGSPWWRRALYDVFVDTPAWVATAEQVGIFGGIINVPGIASRSPAENPTPAVTAAVRARRAMPATDSIEATTARGRKDSGRIPFLLFIAGATYGCALAMTPGCATAGGQALQKCEIGQLPSELQTGVTTVQGVVSDPSSTDQDLESAALALGAAQVPCIISALEAWWSSDQKGEPTPRAAHALKLLQGYRARHNLTACRAGARSG